MPAITITEHQQAIQAARATDDWSHEHTHFSTTDDFGDHQWVLVVVFSTTGAISFRVRAHFTTGGSFDNAAISKIVIASHNGRIQPTVEAVRHTTDFSTFIGWIKNDHTVEDK